MGETSTTARPRLRRGVIYTRMSGPELIARNCPNCGARIDDHPVGGRVACRYCGTSFEIPAEPVAPPPYEMPRVVVIAPGASPARVPLQVSLSRRLGGAFSALILGGVLIAIRFGLVTRTATAPTLHLPTLPVPTLSAFMWDTVGGPPLPVPGSPGAPETFLGRVRMRGDGTLWIAAFDGSKLGVAWKVGPFGTYSEGYQSTFANVVGRSVVVTDYRAVAHVYDLASGRELRSVHLTDRAKAVCPSTDGRPHVWIEQKDEKNVLLDVDQGTAAVAPRPAWCPAAASESGDCRGWLERGSSRPGCKGPTVAPKVSGFEAINVIEQEDQAVALGKRHPGTALPVAVGFDPKTKAVRWQQPIASGDQASAAEASSTSAMDAMAAGRFVTTYELTSKGWHFTAFDAKNGQRLWDVALQPILGMDEPQGFSLSTTRVYVMRTSSLEVYDAKTGAYVGTVGGT